MPVKGYLLLTGFKSNIHGIRGYCRSVLRHFVWSLDYNAKNKQISARFLGKQHEKSNSTRLTLNPFAGSFLRRKDFCCRSSIISSLTCSSACDYTYVSIMPMKGSLMFTLKHTTYEVFFSFLYFHCSISSC
jgi:hypothetical protein